MERQKYYFRCQYIYTTIQWMRTACGKNFLKPGKNANDSIVNTETNCT